MTDVPADTVWLLPTISLWRREVVRFARQRSRIVGALGTPVVLWLLIGSGLGKSFRLGGGGASGGGMDYLEYAFPGTIALILLFTAIFSTISIIEDRREGFLQAVVAAPVHRSAIVLGKVLGSTTLAVGQALLFLCFAPLAGLSLSSAGVLGLAGVLVVVAVGLSALGVLIAWPMESTQGFHAVMNLFLLPMWLLSGASFPASGAPKWLGWVMAINPLSYGVSAIRGALYTGTDNAAGAGSPFWPSVGVSILFASLMTVVATFVVARKR